MAATVGVATSMTLSASSVSSSSVVEVLVEAIVPYIHLVVNAGETALAERCCL